MGIDEFETLGVTNGEIQNDSFNGFVCKAKAGHYQDGRFSTRTDVVNHYDSYFMPHLITEENRNLAEYLESLQPLVKMNRYGIRKVVGKKETTVAPFTKLRFVHVFPLLANRFPFCVNI